MKKKYFSIFLVSSLVLQAQNIGIGTKVPTEKLDVLGNVKFSGSLMPNNTAGTSGQVLTSSGLGNSPIWATPISKDGIYTGSGSLSGNTIVTQGTNTLAFIPTTINGFSVDGSTFSIDALNNKVGIGTTTPQSALEIIGVNSGPQDDISIKSYDTSFTNGGTLILTKSRGTPLSPSNLSLNDNIGGIMFNGHINSVPNTLTSQINVQYRGNGLTNLTNMTFITSASERLRIDENGNVGIGTANPTAKLHNTGSTRLQSLPTTTNETFSNLVVDATGLVHTRINTIVNQATRNYNAYMGSMVATNIGSKDSPNGGAHFEVTTLDGKFQVRFMIGNGASLTLTDVEIRSNTGSPESIMYNGKYSAAGATGATGSNNLTIPTTYITFGNPDVYFSQAPESREYMWTTINGSDKKMYRYNFLFATPTNANYTNYTSTKCFIEAEEVITN